MTDLVQNREPLHRKPWPNPTPEQLKSPEFQAVWDVIKTWDISVREVYGGYMSATGNHVAAILNALPRDQGTPSTLSPRPTLRSILRSLRGRLAGELEEHLHDNPFPARHDDRLAGYNEAWEVMRAFFSRETAAAQEPSQAELDYLASQIKRT